MKLGELVSRLQTQFIPDVLPRDPEFLQCLCRTADMVERAHQLGSKSLVQGVFRYQQAQLADESFMTPQGEIGVDPLNKCSNAQLLQCSALRELKLRVGATERGASPQFQRRSKLI